MVCLRAGGIKQEDVGLKPEMPYFTTNNPRRTPKITYLHIYESEQFSVISCNIAVLLVCKHAKRSSKLKKKKKKKKLKPLILLNIHFTIEIYYINKMYISYSCNVTRFPC